MDRRLMVPSNEQRLNIYCGACHERHLFYFEFKTHADRRGCSERVYRGAVCHRIEKVWDCG